MLPSWPDKSDFGFKPELFTSAFENVTITAKQGLWTLKLCCGWAEDEGPAWHTGCPDPVLGEGSIQLGFFSFTWYPIFLGKSLFCMVGRKTRLDCHPWRLGLCPGTGSHDCRGCAIVIPGQIFAVPTHIFGNKWQKHLSLVDSFQTEGTNYV